MLRPTSEFATGPRGPPPPQSVPSPTRLHENGQPDQENNEFGLTARARFGENRFQLHAGGADADIMLFSDILDRLPTGEPHCQPSFRFRQTKDLLQDSRLGLEALIKV